MRKHEGRFIIAILLLNFLLFITGINIIQGGFEIKINAKIKQVSRHDGLQLFYGYGEGFSEENSIATWKRLNSEYGFLVDLDEVDGSKLQELRLDFMTRIIKMATFDGFALQFHGLTIKQINMTDDIWNKAILNDIVYHGKNTVSLLEDDPLIIFDETVVSDIREAYTKSYNAFVMMFGSICFIAFSLETIFCKRIIFFIECIFGRRRKEEATGEEEIDKAREVGWRVFFCLLIFFQCLIMLYWTGQKKSYFIDEIYTYRGAVDLCRQEPTNISWYYGRQQDNVAAENVYTSNGEFMDCITVGDGESIVDQSLGDILKSVLTRNTYEVLLSALLSCHRGIFSKWVPIVLNIIIFCIVQYTFYKIIMHLYCDHKMAAFLMCIYGISSGAAETILYIRHYEMFLLFSMLFTILMLKLLEKESVSILEVLLSLILIWFGFLNSEYMIIYAGVFMATFLAVCIKDKKWDTMRKFLCCYFGGAVGFLIKNFSWIENSLMEKSENDQLYRALNKIFDGDVASIRWMIKEYFQLLWEYTESNIVFWAGIIILTIMLIKKGKAGYVLKNKKIYLVLLSVCLGYVACVGWIAPWASWRYISNIYPIFILLLGALLFWIDCRDIAKYVLMVMCILVGLKSYFANGFSMNTLNLGVYPALIEDVHECIDEYDIIYMDVEQEYRAAALFNSAFMWPQGTDVYITSPETFLENKENAQKTLSQDTILVWVDTRRTWEMRVRPLMRQCGYKDFERICGYGAARSITEFGIYKCSR